MRLRKLAIVIPGILLVTFTSGIAAAQTAPGTPYFSNGRVLEGGSVRTEAPVDSTQGAVLQGGGALAIVPPQLSDSQGNPITRAALNDNTSLTTPNSVSDPELGTFQVNSGVVLGSVRAMLQNGAGQTVGQLGFPISIAFQVVTSRIPAGTIANDNVHISSLDPTTGQLIEIPATQWIFDLATGTALVVTDMPGLLVVTIG